jgi:adenylyltransferase/sulfurtransferase
MVLDGTDNFATRMMIAHICADQKKPLVHSAVAGYAGYLTSFTPYDGVSPSYQCFMPSAPEEANSCSEVGVLGPMAGVLGSMQATEAIKLYCGLGENLIGRILMIDALTWRTRISELPRGEDCPAL